MQRKIWEVRLDFINRWNWTYIIKIYLDWEIVWTSLEQDWKWYYNSLGEINEAIEPLRKLPNIDIEDYTINENWMDITRYAA